MLKTDTTLLRTPVYEEEQAPYQQRWEELRARACALIDYRLEQGSRYEWYEECFLDTKREFEELDEIEDPREVNEVSRGILAEVFFMEACLSLCLKCTPASADEDVWGQDFKLSGFGETRFLDVTINNSSKGLRKKNRAGTFPTIFIPWQIDGSKNRDIPTYAQWYIETGQFDPKEFIRAIVDYNKRNLHILRQSVWRDGKVEEGGYMGLDGILYLQNLEGVLRILERAI